MIVALAALVGFVAVAGGAFGAHALTDEQARAWAATAGQQMSVHAVAALAVVALARQSGRPAGIAPLLFLFGAAVFGGALFALALGAPRWMGAVAPVGGVSLIAGWAVLGLSVLRRGG
jgi:uncharacterized membrane protein YgdD (TMEM256/DUF423 family)